eukprot:Selendium_serpulae@DN866_c0_g1_i1.p1
MDFEAIDNTDGKMKIATEDGGDPKEAPMKDADMGEEDNAATSNLNENNELMDEDSVNEMDDESEEADDLPHGVCSMDAHPSGLLAVGTISGRVALYYGDIPSYLESLTKDVNVAETLGSDSQVQPITTPSVPLKLVAILSEHEDSVEALRFAPPAAAAALTGGSSSAVLATSSLSGTVCVWDCGQKTCIMRVKINEAGGITTLKWFPDNSSPFIVFGDNNGSLWVGDARNGAKLGQYSGHSASINALAVAEVPLTDDKNNKNKMYIAATASDDNFAKVWDLTLSGTD